MFWSWLRHWFTIMASLLWQTIGSVWESVRRCRHLNLPHAQQSEWFGSPLLFSEGKNIVFGRPREFEFISVSGCVQFVTPVVLRTWIVELWLWSWVSPASNFESIKNRRMTYDWRTWMEFHLLAMSFWRPRSCVLVGVSWINVLPINGGWAWLHILGRDFSSLICLRRIHIDGSRVDFSILYGRADLWSLDLPPRLCPRLRPVSWSHFLNHSSGRKLDMRTILDVSAFWRKTTKNNLAQGYHPNFWMRKRWFEQTPLVMDTDCSRALLIYLGQSALDSVTCQGSAKVFLMNLGHMIAIAVSRLGLERLSQRDGWCWLARMKQWFKLAPELSRFEYNTLVLGGSFLLGLGTLESRRLRFRSGPSEERTGKRG